MTTKASWRGTNRDATARQSNQGNISKLVCIAAVGFRHLTELSPTTQPFALHAIAETRDLALSLLHSFSLMRPRRNPVN